ncbi:fibronectin type III domain-containing protein [Bacillus alkalisoli]|uniref:fibronectin type III domain-containing protein n=1 Tax=Bacillus alkalisoli TaxID=2011008 RepID=UPI000C2431AA|nr:fibronectin type III domain-containing protein [Bacillus alkalisoli]
MERFFKKVTILAIFLILSQVLLPVVSALANTSSMLPPSNLAVQKVTPDDIQLTWGQVHGATGYNIYEITEGQIIFHGKSTTTSYSVKGLAEGSYQYVVSTLVGDWESGPSAPVSVNIEYPIMEAPATVTSVVQNGNDIVLNWPASSYVESYQVHKINDDGVGEVISTVSSSTYTLENVTEGNYSFAVSAKNALYGESDQSSPVQVEVVFPTMTAPNNAAYTLNNGNDITLKWDAVPYAIQYNVYQVTNEGKTLIHTISDTKLTLPNMNVGQYIYEVHSTSDRFGESVSGSQITAEVSDITMTAPSNFTYRIQNLNDVVLTWTAVPYATNYKVYQVKNSEKTLISTVTGTSITYTNLPGGDYVYEVHANSDRFGESTEASSVSLTVEAVTMKAPTNFAYKINNGNDISLSWNSTPNTNNYKVYQVINGEKSLRSKVSGTSVTYSNMAEGEYSFEVHSFSTKYGESNESSKLSIDLVHPVVLPPSNLIQSINHATSFSLNWDAATFATNYRVYQLVDGQKVLRSTTTGRSVTYSNMAPGEYTYIVHTYSNRFGESPEGTQLKVTLNGQTMQPPTVTSTVNNGNDIRLAWNSVQYANRYHIYEVMDGERVLKTSVTGTAVTFSNLPEGEYHFVVHSVSNLLGESPEGAKQLITLVHPVMEAPKNITSRVQNGNDVVINWGSVPFANSYNVYELVDGKKEWRRTITSLSTTLTNVAEGERHYVVHSVSNRFGESIEGSEVSESIIFPEMQKPQNFTYTINNGNDVALKWDASLFANSYKVYQYIDGELKLERTVTSTSTTFSNMLEGEHEYIVHAYSSRFGESMEGSEVTLELVHPSMQAPINLTYSMNNGNDIVLRWNSAQFATNYYVYQVIGEELVLQRTLTGTAVTFVNMPEGNYEYVVHSYSSRFGESPEGTQISFELIHPTMQAPENVTYSINNGNDIVLRWNRADYATNYHIYQLIDSKLVLQRTVTGTSVTFANMPEGDYQYVVHSFSNRFDESPEGSLLPFTLVWPVVQSPQVTGTVFNANNITFTWPIASWATEYRVYKVTNDTRELLYKGTARNFTVHNLTEETHSFEVTSYHTRFGESAPSNLITETIVYPVMQAPTANLVLLSDTSARISWNFVTYANGYNIYELLDGELVLVAEKVNNLSYTITNMSYANHEYVVTAYSNSFGESDPSNNVLAKLIVDTEPPVTTIHAPENWTNDKVTVTLTATDNETGVANTFYSINDAGFVAGTTFTVESEGVHNIAYYSVDKVGNKENIKTFKVKIDKTLPTTTSNMNQDWLNTAFVVELVPTDASSGIAKTYYAINNENFIEGTSFTLSEDGIYEVKYYSVDHAGNVEEIKMELVKIDKTAPVTTSNIVTEWLTEDFELELLAVDNHSGVSETYFSINGSPYIQGTSFTFEEDGIYEVTYFSKDIAGNIERINTEFVRIDKTAPETSSNIGNEWLTETFKMELQFVDNNSGVFETYFSINGSLFTQGTSFTFEKEGVFEVTYFSKDHAGNTERLKKEHVKIDKTAPETSSNIVNEWLTETFEMELYATDIHSGVSETYYSINGSPYVSGTSFTFEEEGIYEVTYYSIDNAGNMERIITEFVKIDKSAPVATWEYADEYELDTELDLFYHATDSLSGIRQESLLVNGKVYQLGNKLVLDKPGKYTIQLEVINHAGLVTKLEKTFVVYIPLADFEVLPKVITPNTGVFTVKVTLPSKFNSNGFDLDTITLNGVQALSTNNGYKQQARLGQFKFNRSDLDWGQHEQTLQFRGYVDGQLVVGYTTVKVQGKK